MRSTASPLKRLIALGAVALWAGGLAPTYADDRSGQRQSHGAAREDHRSAPRAQARPAPADRRMSTEHRGRTETRRPRERETAHAHERWRISSNARRHHTVPPHRPVHALPARHQIVMHRGARFHYHHGLWYRPHGHLFIPVAAPLGAVVHLLPAYHTRIWFYSVPFPFYYANYVYYVHTPQGYVVSEPPPQQIIEEEPANGTDGASVTEEPAASGAVNQANADQLYVYPKQGQSQQQLDMDRSECRSWAASQTGYDQPAPSVQSSDTIADYERALSACLEGRGYAVK